MSTDDPYAAVFGPNPTVPTTVDAPDPYAGLGLPPIQTTPQQPPDTRPWLTRANEGAGDAIRGFTNAVTFGQMDRLAGAGDYYTGRGGPSNLSDLVAGKQAPQSYDESVNRQVALSEAAAKRSPYAYTGGQLVGAAALPGFGAEALAAKWGNTAVKSAREAAAARAAAYGTVGAGQGVVAGAGNTYTGNLSDYATNALIGGTFGGLTGGAMGSILGPRAPVTAAETPTASKIYDASDHVYKVLENNHGKIYENPYLATEGDKVAANTSHIYPGFIPATNHAIEQMRASALEPGGGNSPAEIERIRQGVNQIPRQDPAFEADRKAANQVRDAIDNFYTNPPLGAVKTGHEAEAADAAETAILGRKLWQGASHAQNFEDILHNADVSSRGSHLWGGKSRDDYVFDAVKDLQKTPARGTAGPLQGYNDAENAALEGITKKGVVERGLRTASDYMGGSAGLAKPIGLALTGAAGGSALANYLGYDPKTGAMLGAGVPIAGGALRTWSNAIGRKAIDNAWEVLHQSNPLYDARVMTSGTKSGGGLPGPVNDAARNSIANTLTNRLYIGRNDPSQEDQ